VNEFFQRHKLVGLCAAVVRGQRDIDVAAAGVRRSGFDDRVTPADRWHLGSNSKAFTAFLCARMVERGEIEWRTSLAQVLTELTVDAPREIRDVSLGDLLSHRSGIGDRGIRSWMRRALRDPRLPMEQRLALVKELITEARWTPSPQKGRYSNFGYCLAAAMLERVSGTSWEDMMRAEVFLPLGLNSAGFGSPGGDGSAQPWGHSSGLLRPVPKDPAVSTSDFPSAIGPAGLVHMNLDDWARFARIFFKDYSGETLTAGSIAYLTTPVSVLKELRTSFNSSPYALGWFVLRPGRGNGDLLAHSGSNDYFFASILIEPQRNLAFLIATNTGLFRAIRPVGKLRNALVAYCSRI
jgi:D-alanyl-D-alanine carboxypeptidase